MNKPEKSKCCNAEVKTVGMPDFAECGVSATPQKAECDRCKIIGQNACIEHCEKKVPDCKCGHMKLDHNEDNRCCMSIVCPCGRKFKKVEGIYKSEESVDLFRELANEIAEKHGEIIDNFLKTYVAASTVGLSKEAIVDFIKNCELIMVKDGLRNTYFIRPKISTSELEILQEKAWKYDQLSK